MNILKALGIMAVVGGHCGINFLSWFPVYSFHMPLFIFISGYFFHDQRFASLLKSKVKHLLCPLLLWNLFFGLLCAIFLHYGLIRFGQPLSLENLLFRPLSYPVFEFNAPTWFVGTLFGVQLVYWWVQRICKGHPVILLGVTVLCYGTGWTIMDYQGNPDWAPYMLVMKRVLELLFFYEMGVLYRQYGEAIDSFSVNRIAGVVILNGILIGFVSRNITSSYNVARLAHPIWLPLVVAFTGIYLYLQVAEILKDKVKRKSLLGFIGEHTFSILVMHKLFFWLLNTGFLFLKQYGIFPLRSFNYDKYMQTPYFRVTEHAPMVDGIYFLVGMGGSLLCVYLYERYKPVLRERLRALRS